MNIGDAQGMLNCIVFGTQRSVQTVWYRDYLLVKAYLHRCVSCEWVLRGGAAERSSELTKRYSSNPAHSSATGRRVESGHRVIFSSSQPLQSDQSGNAGSSEHMNRSSGEDNRDIAIVPSADTIRDNSLTRYNDGGSSESSASRYLSTSSDIESFGGASTRVVGFAASGEAHTLDDQAEMK